MSVINDIQHRFTQQEHLENKEAYRAFTRKLDIFFGDLDESLAIPEPDVPGQRKYVEIPRSKETQFVHEIIQEGSKQVKASMKKL